VESGGVFWEKLKSGATGVGAASLVVEVFDDQRERTNTKFECATRVTISIRASTSLHTLSAKKLSDAQHSVFFAQKGFAQGIAHMDAHLHKIC
jgi:hypothetical protein